jgi:ankyrin repeat protein
MRILGTRSTHGSSFSGRAGRVLLALGHLVACVMVPLVAIWPAGDPNPRATAMFLAVQRGNVAAIDAALRDGLDVDSRDDTGVTPLAAAARGGHLEAVRRLLAVGAAMDASVPVVGTPLMVAAMNGHHDVMRELIDRGAKVNAAARPTGRTALWYARVNDDEDAVRLLIAAGAVAEGDATHEAHERTEKSGR